MGYSDPFYDPNSTSTTDVTIKAVRNIIDKYYSLVGSNVDLSNVNYGVVNQSNAWYAKFTTDDYNYVLQVTEKLILLICMATALFMPMREIIQ